MTARVTQDRLGIKLGRCRWVVSSSAVIAASLVGASHEAVIVAADVSRPIGAGVLTLRAAAG
jgi:hypothetical protein